jgi:hypothetical protein
MTVFPATRSGSGTIRPLLREDLEQVARLYARIARSDAGDHPPPRLAHHFADTLLDQPWADPEIPSLVYDQRGVITGFIGSHVRRFEHEGRTLRFAYGGQLVTDPAVRSAAVGLFLLRAFLSGAQDAALTDTAGEATRRMWTRLGGWPAQLESLSWFRLFRPLSFLAHYSLSRRRVRRWPHSAHRLAAVVDRPLEIGFSPRSQTTVLREEALVPEMLVEGIDRLAPALRPSYDLPFVEWLLRSVASVGSRGTLISVALRDQGAIAGWYVYFLRRGGISDVLQVVGLDGRVDAVVDHLFADAYSRGTALLRGRIEPRLLETLAHKRCFFRYNGGALVHARDPTVGAALSAPAALLTRLDGEWWMGHHLESFA